MKPTLFYLGLFLLLTGCAGGTIQWQKMETPLRQKLAEYEMAGEDGTIEFSVITDVPISAQSRRELEKSGITIKTVSDRGFFASGTPESIQRIIRFDYIKRMALRSNL